MSVIQFHPQPTEASVRAYARDAVRAMRTIEDTGLDYGMATLPLLDSVLDQWKGLGAPLAQINQSLYAIGSYVGETVKRHEAGADWFKPDDVDPDVEALRLANLPFLALRLAGGQVYRPINHAFLIMATAPMTANFHKVVERLLKR